MGRELDLDVRESPGVGHLHPLSNPHWFADTITGWVRSLPTA
jgi:hypothetical protein